MKGAAKCDKHCELQNSANQQIFERVLHFRVIPERIPASVSIFSSHHRGYSDVCLCASGGAGSTLTHASHGNATSACSSRSGHRNACCNAGRVCRHCVARWTYFKT